VLAAMARLVANGQVVSNEPELSLTAEYRLADA